MELKRDPLTRTMSSQYIAAVKRTEAPFYVLTNGEHIGSRGVNRIVDAALADDAQSAEDQGLYLPGLAAGGVQWQDCFGKASHPGVSQTEIDFLAAVPKWLHGRLQAALSAPPFLLEPAQLEQILNVIILDNLASPSLNIGSLFHPFSNQAGLYQSLQNLAYQLMQELMQMAKTQGLEGSFFTHLAPNLGTQDGLERLKPAHNEDMGTTDFQFMLRGAVKEAGVLVLLNRYYFQQTGDYPLGEDFSARTAPSSQAEMLALAQAHFDPTIMPCIVGVGDTVTSAKAEDSLGYQRGGSDRGFLTLIQQLGAAFNTDNATIFVDSSQGELNRPGISQKPSPGEAVDHQVMAGITDVEDSLQLNLIFPEGHNQYIEFFTQLATVAPAQ